MRTNAPKGSKKLLNAWAFYDWANSVYSLVIASAVFPIFYGALFSKADITSVEVFGGEIRSTPLISYTTAAAFLVVAFISPLLSGIADYVGNKKNFLKFFCYLGAFSCVGLYFFDLERIYISLLFYFFGLVGFWGSLVFYNSYLPDVAFKELRSVYRSLSETKALKRYLIAFFVYSMAVQTVMLVATYFGEQEIGWGGDDEKTMGLIISILIIQLVAVVGAVLTSRASEKFGNISTLIVINIIWVVICVVAYFVTSPTQFYATAGFVGLVMGGIQSLSRSTYSKFLPETKDTTSYFSFYDVSEKIGIVIGMLLYGFIDQLTGSMRNSILFLVVFFGLGVVLLFRVPRN